MKMNSTGRFLQSRYLPCCFLAFALAVPSVAATIDLGVGVNADVNSLGTTVVGTYDSSASRYGGSVRWSDGMSSQFPSGYRPMAINDPGVVAGVHWLTQDSSRAFIWRDVDNDYQVDASEFSEFQIGSMSHPVAVNGINRNGVVIGVNGGFPFQIDGATQASWTLNGGSITSIFYPSVFDDEGVLTDFTVATGINASGSVVGYGENWHFAVDNDPFAWSSGTFTTLKTPKPPNSGERGRPFGINDAGQIVGEVVRTGEFYEAAIWNSQTQEPAILNPGASGQSRAVDINNHGQVVGYTGTSGFLWDSDHGIRNLSSFAGRTITTPMAISDTGYVVAATGGSGSSIVLFQLDPPQRHLVLVTHGWRDDAAAWPTQIASRIRTQLADRFAGDATVRVGPIGIWSEHDTQLVHVPSEGVDEVWEVVVVDWSDSAGTSLDPTTLLARQTAVQGHAIGKRIGSLLRNEDYASVHLIGHSAGSWLIEGIADKLAQGNSDGSTSDIHETFLDAFTPYNSLLGNDANWAEHYVHNGNTPLTNDTLVNAFNIDITSLDPTPEDPGILDHSGHSWPWQWYLGTTESPNGADAHGWGFVRSMEMVGTHPSHSIYQRGARIDLATGQVIGFNPQALSLLSSQPALTAINTAVSSTGQVSGLNSSGFTLTTGSPVWLTAELEFLEATNLIRFDIEFLSSAHGLLSVFFEDQLVFLAEEQYSDGIETSDWIGLGADFNPGVYHLRIMLEGGDGIQSSLRISNMEFALAHTVPEPSTAVLAGFLFLTVALSRLGRATIGRRRSQIR